MSHAFLPHVGSSRVENIKKRFETNTSSSGSESVSPRLSPERSAPDRKVAVALTSSNDGTSKAVIKKTSPTIRNTISNLSESSNRVNGKNRQVSPARFPKYERQLSSSSSRGSNVKRSPAFRCDKMVKGRNVVGYSRLHGERAKSFMEDCSQFKSETNKSSIKHADNLLHPVRSEKDNGLRATNDELSTVFSQRNLKSNIKSNLASPSRKPEVLQKPQVNAVLSPKLESLTQSKPSNNRPVSLQLTKPSPSTNKPRPVEYAVVDKNNKISDGRRLDTSKFANSEPRVALRSKHEKQSLINKPSKSLITNTEESPLVNRPASYTKDLPTKSAQPIDLSYIAVQQSDEMTREISGPDRINITNDVCLQNTIGEEGVTLLGKDVSGLQLTSSLKKALSSPLPAGPPPKKPPRTFAHIAVNSTKSFDERNTRFYSISDEDGQSLATNPNIVAFKNDLQNRVKPNVNIAKEQLKSTATNSPNLYGKTRRPILDKLGRPPNFTRNNSPQNNFSNLHVPNGMRSIRNMFPTMKSTENLSGPFRVGYEAVGPKNVNLNTSPPGNRDKIMAKPLRSKTESEIMLRKLENVLQNHQSSGVILRPKSPMAPRRMVDKATGSRNQNSTMAKGHGSPSIRPLPVVPKNQRNLPSQTPEASSGTLFGGCLDSISCVGIDPLYARTSNFYEKLNAKNSEFFVTGYTDLLSNQEPALVESRNSLYGQMRKSSSVEHIYAEPFDFLKESSGGNMSHSLESRPRFSGNKVPVLAVTSDKIVEIGHYRDTVVSPQNVNIQFPGCETAGVEARKKSDDLHYLCTPISPEDPERMGSAAGGPEATGTLSRPDGGDGDAAETPPSSAAGGGGRPPHRNKIHQLLSQAFNLASLPLDGTPEDPDPPSSPDEAAPTGPDRAGAPQPASGESEREMSQVTERRVRYLTRHNSSVAPARRPQDFPQLFHCLLLVGLTMYQEGGGRCRPYIKWKYPPEAEVARHIEHLCFPDAADWPTRRGLAGGVGERCYSLVVTDERGRRTFGYCRRVLPEGMDVCLPLAYCIVSPVRATGFYYKVLQELESLHGQPEAATASLVAELYQTRLPGPGQALKPASAPGQGGWRCATLVRRPLDLRLEERDLTHLFSSLCVSTLLQVFSSLLLERRVVLIGSSLGKVSSCVEALQSILYPFSWQHTFIPVLPSSQLELCDAPTPYVFGILKDEDGRAPQLSVTDGVLVDLETNSLLSKVGDETTILPARLRHSLKVALQLVSATADGDVGDPARNVLISEAFVRMFVEACGHYGQHVATGPDGRRHFQREAFVGAVTEPAMRHFLEWFTMTAMFSAFVEARVEGGARAARGVFEQRAAEHSDEVRKNAALYLRNSRLVNAKLKTLGNRIRDGMSLNKNA